MAVEVLNELCNYVFDHSSTSNASLNVDDHIALVQSAVAVKDSDSDEEQSGEGSDGDSDTGEIWDDDMELLFD